MKYFVSSDIHGSYYWADKMMDRFEASGAKRMICLGDILYHGPRNDLPRDYEPKKVIELMNSIKDRVWAVRGNCEAEVDQMVLEFPVLADYAILALEDYTIFATHGHLYNEEKLPPIMSGDILLHGHTHLPVCEKLPLKVETGDSNNDKNINNDSNNNSNNCNSSHTNSFYYHLNPGSVAIPKGGNPNSYAILEDDVFSIYDFDGNVINEIHLG